MTGFEGVYVYDKGEITVTKHNRTACGYKVTCGSTVSFMGLGALKKYLFQIGARSQWGITRKN